MRRSPWPIALLACALFWLAAAPRRADEIDDPDEIPYPDAQPRGDDEIQYPDAQPRAHDEIACPDAKPRVHDAMPRDPDAIDQRSTETRPAGRPVHPPDATPVNAPT